MIYTLAYHHHHHVVPLARISLTFSFATSPFSSSPLAGLQRYIPYPHRAAVCMFELVVLLLLGHMGGVHRSTSLMSSSLLLQQCPACLVRVTWIVFVMGGRWLYSWCLVACCSQHSCVILFTNPFARAGYDTWSIFKRSLTGLNSEFSFEFRVFLFQD